MKLLALSIALLTAAVLTFPALAEKESDWTEDFAKASEQAKAENKTLLLNFTGSDWCGFCKILDAEVFSTSKFKRWAKKNVVLVTVDFPRSKTLEPAVKAQNTELARKYPAKGFPTLVLLDPAGQELGRRSGYGPGTGPDKLTDELDALLKKAGKSEPTAKAGGASNWPFSKAAEPAK